MAKARMLHKKISISSQVNRLSLPARLLFTWMISHADDDGKIQGDPEYIKATVVPMTKWSFKKIQQYLEEMKTETLIYYWEQNNERFIQFIKWKEYQQIKSDRYKSSNLPSYTNKFGETLDTSRLQDGSLNTPQYNKSETNKVEVNKSEYKQITRLADNHTFKKISNIIDPRQYQPRSAVEVAAIDAWGKIEPNNTSAFFTTYLNAAKKGLPENLFYQFSSEIKHDPNIKNPGAIFNTKVKEYLDKKV